MYNFYGKSGSKGEALVLTETICEGGRRDVEMSSPAPTIFLGDFNATPDTLITIKTLIEERRWTDVGRKAHGWGRKPDQPTCHSNSKAKKSRIDGIVVDVETLASIHNFEVEKQNRTRILTVLRLD